MEKLCKHCEFVNVTAWPVSCDGRNKDKAYTCRHSAPRRLSADGGAAAKWPIVEPRCWCGDGLWRNEDDGRFYGWLEDPPRVNDVHLIEEIPSAGR